MAKYRTLLVVVALLATIALVSATAGADTIADPQIFVQQSGQNPAGGDPNLITDITAFNVGVAGSFILQDPLLIIVGVYNGDGTPCISFGAISCEGAATVGTYHLTSNVFAGFNSGDAYSTLGLNGGANSELFTNWSTADQNIGLLAPTSFTLYAFSIDTSLQSTQAISIDESGAALGSFIIAYDCRQGTGSSAGCTHNGDVGATPFTNAGLIDTQEHRPPVPEPASLALLGSGLVLIGGLLRRKFGWSVN